jgi:hypothetical protein
MRLKKTAGRTSPLVIKLRMSWMDMQYARKRQEVHTKF